MAKKPTDITSVNAGKKPFQFKEIGLKENHWQIYLLIAIAFGLYFNSLFNEYAFDDSTYILENSYVQQGFKGIGKLLTSDALESYIKAKGGTTYELSGGRYRPLSLVTFAIEKSIFGGNVLISHLVNVLLYLLTVLVLLRLLTQRFFTRQPWLAFLATLIFTIHPLHTEVVANIKSRDEILSLLFILLSLDYFFRYMDIKGRDAKHGVSTKNFSWLFFFLALLSKEYGLMMVFLIPVVSYVMLKKNAKEAIVYTIPFIAISVVYIIIRLSATGGINPAEVKTIVNNPYLLASMGQKWATKVFVLFYYVKLLFIPYLLSCDYSYDTFHYRTFSDPTVIVSCLFYLGLIFLTFYWLKKRNILSIASFFFLLPLFLVSNFVVDIGATMGERLVYHSSVGFAMLVSYGLIELVKRVIQSEKTRNNIVIGASGLLTVAAAFVIVPRNAQWKNSTTLFTHDVQVVPKSLLMNHNAALKLMEDAMVEENVAVKDSLFHTAIFYLKRATVIYSKWEYLPVSLGVVYYQMGELDSAALRWKQAAKEFTGLEMAKNNLAALAKDYFNQAVTLGKQGDWNGSVIKLKKAIDADSTNTTYWYNLGGVYYSQKDFVNARQAWEKTLEIDPNFKDARGGLEAIKSAGG